MDSEKFNDWLQIAGMLGIMASLVFVGVQVRQTQTIGEGESATQFLDATISARQVFIDNIDVWIKGCAGEELSITEEAQLHICSGPIQWAVILLGLVRGATLLNSTPKVLFTHSPPTFIDIRDLHG